MRIFKHTHPLGNSNGHSRNEESVGRSHDHRKTCSKQRLNQRVNGRNKKLSLYHFSLLLLFYFISKEEEILMKQKIKQIHISSCIHENAIKKTSEVLLHCHHPSEGQGWRKPWQWSQAQPRNAETQVKSLQLQPNQTKAKKKKKNKQE